MIEHFNFLKFSPYSNTLIEASAGTGKTHIIVMIYLRLLLGIGKNKFQIRPFSVKEILIVTFTKKAIEELRKRIRKNICELRYACILGYSTNNTSLSEILTQIYDVNLAYNQLIQAEQEIDTAPIFTIHSFCHYILNQYPIELNAFLQYTILQNDDYLLKNSCNDFWRRYLYSLPKEIVDIIQNYWKSPEHLLLEIYPYIHKETIHIKTSFLCPENNILLQHQYILNCINNVKKAWNLENNQILKILDNHKFNRRIYNQKNIQKWFNIIDKWSSDTNQIQNYTIPKELKRFTFSTLFDTNDLVFDQNDINLYRLKCSFFELTEIMYRDIMSLKQLILSMAIRNIRQNIKDEKYSSALFSFDDLVHLLDIALSSEKMSYLAKLIRTNYPIAIIDEFQDTDTHQCRIFYSLYFKQSKCGLLLIADPKQAIYSFRGASIFSYLQIRKKIDYLYTLKVNWRASKNMVNAINVLFQFKSNPFIFCDIPFTALDVTKNNYGMRFVVQNKLYPALCFCLHPSDKIILSKYQKFMAYQCANKINNLLYLSGQNDAWLENNQNKKLLHISDIVILVRNYREASLMSSILEEFNIPSVYLSNQNTIFKTLEASDLLSILQAILMPENNNMLRIALITKILGYDAKKIESISCNDIQWNKEVEEFHSYHVFWKKYGIKPMLQEIIFRRRIMNNLLDSKLNEQYLTNILHLLELCQQASLELNNEYDLIHWLKMNIQSSNECNDINDYLLRSNINSHSIRIMTIYQAKGLEFPLVFLPFINNFHEDKYPCFHDRKNHQIYLDLSRSTSSFHLSNEEKLSEDLRLLYVAITRAIYHCFIGIGSVCFKKNKTRNFHELHCSALGYIVQKGFSGDLKFLKECLKKLVTYSNGDIVYYIDVINDQISKLSSVQNNINVVNIIEKRKIISARTWKPITDNLLKVTSYSELNRFNISSKLVSNFKLCEIPILEIDKICQDNMILSSHTFPQGVLSGKFLHYILQTWDCTKEINDKWLILQLQKYSIDLIWLPILQEWMLAIVNTSLNSDNLMLSKLLPKDRSPEFQFYLSINNLVSAQEVNKLCKLYDNLSNSGSPLTFPKILGMLHGFIDLVFLWNDKYYLLDYKSNWLGKTYSSYVKCIIEQEMISHNYTLQYQIYTLALHRFLRHKLKYYDYEKNFGGVYYLFLRGMNVNYPGYGVYFCRPKLSLIDKLDHLLFHS